MSVRQKFPYWEWEDYQMGMYDLAVLRGTVDHAREVLTSCGLERVMRQAVQQWPKAAAHHLTDGGMNQRAWLGWAACAIAGNTPAHLTRAAWWQLSDGERATANDAADRVIAGYVSPYAQTLFDD